MNSTAYANRAISPFRRFNSHRIELFHIPAGRYKMQWQKFQFPTRWNSTKPKRSKKQSKSVSVPNGMEIYTLVLVRVAPLMGFNSQRDGILQRLADLRQAKRSFQFPTGWNSTNCLGVVISSAPMFQFPMGWNSTQALPSESYKYEVSIPNGMEFYRFYIAFS